MDGDQAALMSKKKLEGKVVIVTGGAMGIGEAAARLFAHNGARMVVIADIQDEVGKRVAESIGLEHATYFHCDVTDEDQVKAMVEWTVQNYKQLDIMLSNAGMMNKSDQTIVDLGFSDYDRLFAINVRGSAACVKHAARAMIDGHVRGSIVCTASVVATCGFEMSTDYVMSKHAVLGLVRSASIQLGVHGIRVNCVSPYIVPTPMSIAGFGMNPEELEKLQEPNIALKGVALKTSHIADALMLLASNDLECVTGHNLVVDCGFLAKRT